MNAYQQEQLNGQHQVWQALGKIPTDLKRQLSRQVAPYLEFRNRVDRFLNRHCSGMCTQACFENRLSACCSRDGIITFWADLVVNSMHADPAQFQRLIRSIENPLNVKKCIYLGDQGCVWQIRPLVCAMFLCDGVTVDLLEENPLLKRQWSALSDQARSYRWPDRPVLFDTLEKVFIDQGYRSDLMYLHQSPGLLRIKQKAGLA